MSEFHLTCGHIVDGHSIVWIRKQGLKAFKIFQKYLGKKTVSEIIKKGGGFKKEYIDSGVGEVFAICASCFSEWQLYQQ